MSRSESGIGAKQLWGGLLLLATAALVRIWGWQQTSVLFDDGPIFLALAEAVSDGDFARVLAHPYHPLYPIAVAPWIVLGIPAETAAVSVSIAAGVVSVALTFDLLRQLFDEGIAWVGAWMLALHPHAVAVSSDVQSDGLYLACFLAGLCALVRSQRSEDWGASFAAGAASGLAYLVRPEGLGVALIAMFLRASGPGSRAARARGVVAIAVAAATIALPYAIAIHAQSGEWRLTQKKSLVQLVGLDRESGVQDAGRAASPSAIPLPAGPSEEALAEGRSLGAAVEDLYRAAVSALRLELLPFVLLGLAMARGRPRFRGRLVLALVGLYGAVLFGLSLHAGYVSRRHALPPLVPLLGYAAMGVLVVVDSVRARLRASGDSGVAWPRSFALALGPLPQARGPVAQGRGPLVAGAVAVVMLLLMPSALSPRRPGREGERRAAEWLARSVSSGETFAVAAGRPRIAYYAGARFVRLPAAASDDPVRDLRRRGARYLILAEEKRIGRPRLSEAIDAGESRREITRLHRQSSERGNVDVYELHTPQSFVESGG